MGYSVKGRRYRGHLTASSCNGHWDLQSSVGVVVSVDIPEAEKSDN